MKASDLLSSSKKEKNIIQLGHFKSSVCGIGRILGRDMRVATKRMCDLLSLAK